MIFSQKMKGKAHTCDVSQCKWEFTQSCKNHGTSKNKFTLSFMISVSEFIILYWKTHSKTTPQILGALSKEKQL